MMVKSTYYLGNFNRNSYKTTICSSDDLNSPIKNCKKVSKTWNGYVGLLRIGELFARHGNKSYILWSISPESDKKIYVIHSIATVDPYDVSKLNCVKPVITLSSDVTITSGEGTYDSPFEIDCPNCNNT